MSKRKGPDRRRTSNAAPGSRPARTAHVRAQDSAPDEAGPSRSPLARLLDAPHLTRLVPHLAPETLHQLIQHGGLHACWRARRAATPAQLTSVLDLDLWRGAQPGRDDQFDADRFGDWLEVLVDTGDAVAARNRGRARRKLVIAGLSRYVPRLRSVGDRRARVARMTRRMDVEVTSPRRTSIAKSAAIRCLRSGQTRGTRSWRCSSRSTPDHPDCFHAVMRGCRRLSNSAPEVDGLDDLLTAPEQLLHDVALDRAHPAVAAGIQHAGRRACVSPDGEAAETQAVARDESDRHGVFRAADDSPRQSAPTATPG